MVLLSIGLVAVPAGTLPKAPILKPSAEREAEPKQSSGEREHVLAKVVDLSPLVGDIAKAVDRSVASPDLIAPEGSVRRVPAAKPVESDRSNKIIELLKAAAIPVIGAPPPKPALAPELVEEASPIADLTRRVATAESGRPDTIQALQHALRKRDAVIADLLRRVEQLERRIVLSAAQLNQAVGGAGPVSLRHRSRGEAAALESGPGAASPKPAAESADASDQVREAQAQVPETTAAPPTAPGQFDVDEDLIDRALERTLVQEGVLLLPFGQAEIEPAFEYTRRENDFPFGIGGTVAEGKVRRNEFETSATVRIGLPFDSQVELGIPYNVVGESFTGEVNGVPQNNSSETGSGFGDASVGLAKTLLREDGSWWPDLIGRVTYDAGTGKTRDNGVFLGGGFNEVGGSLSAVKRQDPLAFVGSVSYAKTFEHDDVEPGDEIGFSLGTVLAASPETSLSFFFSQTFADDTKIDGEKIDGSDQVVGTFGVGAATTLGRNVLLSVTGNIGLTDDAPDYSVGVSLPIRFNIPTN
jgi:hypothetical protein